VHLGLQMQRYLNWITLSANNTSMTTQQQKLWILYTYWFTAEFFSDRYHATALAMIKLRKTARLPDPLLQSGVVTCNNRA